MSDRPLSVPEYLVGDEPDDAPRHISRAALDAAQERVDRALAAWVRRQQEDAA